MTDIVPVDIPTTQVETYVPPFLPLENISPFTLRDGYGYLEILQRLRHYINQDLVPFVNSQVDILGTGFTTEVNKVITNINTALSQQEANVEAAIAAEKDYVDGVLATEKDHVDTSIQQLTDYINTQIQSIIDNSIEANDAVVSQLINTASLVQAALDGRYSQLSDQDTDVAALITGPSVTRDAMDDRYFQSSGSTLDVAHGGTGRNTASIAHGIIAAGADADDPMETIDPGTAGQFMVSNGANAKPGMKTVIDDNTPGTSKVYSSTKTQAIVDTTAGAVHLSGLYSARPGFASVKAGTVYYATDVQELYRATGTAGQAATGWAVYGPGGAEVAYAEITATQTIASTSATDVTGLSITVIHGERPIEITFQGIINGSQQAAGILAEGIVSIYDVTVPGTPVQVYEGHGFTTDGSVYTTLRFDKRISGVAPGTTKVYGIKANRGYNSGTASTGLRMMASSVFPAFIKARTV